MTNAPMTFYRVQDDSGRGPWRPGLSRFWIDETSDRDLFPPWWEGCITPERVKRQLKGGERAVCACESMADLMAWFTPVELDRLRRIGYRIVSFVPKRVLYRLPSSRQSIVVVPK